MPVVLKIPSEIEETKDEVKATLIGHIIGVHDFTPPPHQLPWIEALEDLSIRRLLIIAPPKYGKTPVVGLDYAGWRIGVDPNVHFIYVSNTALQAYKPSVALRDMIERNNAYRFLYGLEPDVNKGWSESEWFIKRDNVSDKDPTFQATGVFGPILGGTVQEIVFDDIADQENMATAYQREKLMEWVKGTALSRLVPWGRAIGICTRWHENDPAAEFEKDGWVVIRMPAFDKDGKATYPEYWDEKSLEARRVDLGTRMFELMFQGNVLPAEGGIFKREWWRYWKQGFAPWQVEGPVHSPIQTIVQSWDTAFKEKQKNDYSACATWAILKTGYYLLDIWRGKVEFPMLKQVAESLWKKWNPVAVLIEDAASGQSLIQELKAITRMPVIAIKVDTDKSSRAHAVTPMFEAEKVWIPEDASWRSAFEHEHEIFPGGANDDQVDTTTQFLNWARRRQVSSSAKATEVLQESRWSRL